MGNDFHVSENEIPKRPLIILNADQRRALNEIMAAYDHGERHLLTGYAGTGKTTLMQYVVSAFMDQGQTVAVTAPTHKAVAVLARKLRDAEIEVGCSTIHSLLSLRPRIVEDRQVFTRQARANPVLVDVVIIDEASMISAELMAHIRDYLRWQFILFVGDPAQLPPVGERRSQAFDVRSRSHLDTIVRQAQGNPILEGSRIIRESQERGEPDWSWVDLPRAGNQGILRPGPGMVKWMEKAFLSSEFDCDPDYARYLCWTNARVHLVNKMVRRWRYGKTETPLVAGEPCMARTPVFLHSWNEEYEKEETDIVMQTCEEGMILGIDQGSFSKRLGHPDDKDKFSVEFPTWECRIEKQDGAEVQCRMPISEMVYKKAENKIRAWCKDREDWRPLFRFMENFTDLRPLYALTVHSSQGSTFKHSFVDIDDIAKREERNLLECQQLLYVAVTRSTDTVILGGVE